MYIYVCECSGVCEMEVDGANLWVVDFTWFHKTSLIFIHIHIPSTECVLNDCFAGIAPSCSTIPTTFKCCQIAKMVYVFHCLANTYKSSKPMTFRMCQHNIYTCIIAETHHREQAYIEWFRYFRHALPVSYTAKRMRKIFIQNRRIFCHFEITSFDHTKHVFI